MASGPVPTGQETGDDSIDREWLVTLLTEVSAAWLVLDGLGNVWRRYNDVGWVMLLTANKDAVAAQPSILDLPSPVEILKVRHAGAAQLREPSRRKVGWRRG